MDETDIRLKQAAKMILKYMLEEVVFDFGSDKANDDFKSLINRIYHPKSPNRFRNLSSQKGQPPD